MHWLEKIDEQNKQKQMLVKKSNAMKNSKIMTKKRC
jgi:hypothetical protein